MGTSLAKMSGPVTAGSVGFTGKGFTKGAPGRERKNGGNQAHTASSLPLFYTPIFTLSSHPRPPLSSRPFTG